MYGWIWRQLPGPLWMRLGSAALLFVGVLALLFLVVFPAVEPHLALTRVAPRG